MIDLPVRADVHYSDRVVEGRSTPFYDATVNATDGYVGKVDGLLIHSHRMQVTHLILIVRHIFDAGRITIPVSQIDHIGNGTIHLKLDRKKVKELATATIRH